LLKVLNINNFVEQWLLIFVYFCFADLETTKQRCSQLLYPFTKNYVLMLAVLVLFAIFGLFAIYVWMLYAVHQKLVYSGYF